ncbi:hypothetical protein FOZ62_008035, partial [Perkinsus olseni]
MKIAAFRTEMPLRLKGILKCTGESHDEILISNTLAVSLSAAAQFLRAFAMETLCTLPAGAQYWHKTVLATSSNHLAYLSTLTLNVLRISDLTPVDTRESTFGSVRDEMLAAVIRNPHGDDEFLVVSCTGRATLVRVEGGYLAPSPGAQEPFQLAMPAGSARRTESVSEILLDSDAVEEGVLWYYHLAESGEHQLR